MSIVNPFIAVVAALQIVGGIYSGFTSDWKLAAINIAVGIANCVLSTVRG